MAEMGTLALMIDVVERLVDLAGRRGDGSGMNALRQRTRGLLDPPKHPRTAVERERASIDLEYEYWSVAISEFLLPAHRDLVVAALRPDGEHDESEDPWALLDPDTCRGWDLAAGAKVSRALQAASAACRHYEGTRRTNFLRDAVFELESAVRYERRRPFSGLPKDASREQGDRLGRALREVLPTSAFCFFAKTVREVIGQDLAGTVRTSGARSWKPEQMLSRETWTESLDAERAGGVWFVDALQDRYEVQMERNRLAEEADERRRKQAAEYHRQWQATRDEEARLRRAEEEALERAAAKERSRPPSSSDPKLKQTPEVPPPPNLKMHRDYVAWPAHAEENARLNEESQRRAIAEQAELAEARYVSASREAERVRAEAEEGRRVEAFQARARRKASPARIQSGR
jgi:hypothetical protein